MSFGFSVGDFVSVGKLAWGVFRSCKAAPGEFQELSKEVSTLHTALKELEDEASDPQSLLNRRGARRKDELFMIRDNIEAALQQLDDIVKRYQSLGRQEKKTWDRIRFAAEDLDAIRGKLVFHTSAISLFLQSLSVGSLGRIEVVLEDLVREVRAGKKEKTLLSACGEGEDDDSGALAWAELKKELVEEGISGQDIEKYKDAIKLHLKNLVGGNTEGGEEEETTDRESTASGDWRSDDEWESASQRGGLDEIEMGYSKDMGPDESLRARLDRPLDYLVLGTLKAGVIGAQNAGVRREGGRTRIRRSERSESPSCDRPLDYPVPGILEAGVIGAQNAGMRRERERRRSESSESLSFDRPSNARAGNEDDDWPFPGGDKTNPSPNAGGGNENNAPPSTWCRTESSRIAGVENEGNVWGWGGKKSTESAGAGKEDKGSKEKKPTTKPAGMISSFSDYMRGRPPQHKTKTPHHKQDKKEPHAASQNATPVTPKRLPYQSRSGLHWLQSSHSERKRKPPKTGTPFDNMRTRTCSGCYANTRGSESAKLSCGHRLCNRCLKSLFKRSEENARYMPPICCNVADHIPLRYVDSLFDNGFKRRWNKKYQEKYHSSSLKE